MVASLRHRWCHATRKDSAKVSRFLSSTFQAEKASKDAVMESFLAGHCHNGSKRQIFWGHGDRSTFAFIYAMVRDDHAIICHLC